MIFLFSLVLFSLIWWAFLYLEDETILKIIEKEQFYENLTYVRYHKPDLKNRFAFAREFIIDDKVYSIESYAGRCMGCGRSCKAGEMRYVDTFKTSDMIFKKCSYCHMQYAFNIKKDVTEKQRLWVRKIPFTKERVNKHSDIRTLYSDVKQIIQRKKE